MTRRPHRRVAWVAIVLCLTLGAAACTGDEESGTAAAPPGSPGSGAAPEQVATTSRMGVVAGDLPRPARKRARAGVSKAVDRWINAAYVGGDYPRSTFKDAYPRFTQGARRQARQQQELMSNADIGERIDGVEVTRRSIVVDTVADRRRAVGATARVSLRFSTTGDLQRTVTVKGRLFLTRGKQGWRVFGFDVAKGVR